MFITIVSKQNHFAQCYMRLAAFPPLSYICSMYRAGLVYQSSLITMAVCAVVAGGQEPPVCCTYGLRGDPPPCRMLSSLPLHHKDQQLASLGDVLGESEIMCQITNHSPSLANLCCREMDLKCANTINQMLLKESKPERTDRGKESLLSQAADNVYNYMWILFLFTRFVDKFALPFSNTKEQ